MSNRNIVELRYCLARPLTIRLVFSSQAIRLGILRMSEVSNAMDDRKKTIWA
jgi:hypothetical protein